MSVGIGIGLGSGIMVASALLYGLSPEPLIAIFLGDRTDAESLAVAALAAQLLLLAGVFQVFDGAQTVANGALRGLKDTFWPMVIGVVSYWAIGLSMGVYLMQGRGARGLWIGIIVGLAAAAAALIGRWARLSGRSLSR